ncbi:hypothetical protein IFM89_005338 [Coptis chinensis]|uniref:F-box domain-containing protein n=1 Tax=Coptis chinensis TaxID=261450 RepID=A0A835LKI5_9MAGN|nr:hypothetical protein IFM89_005338 [Coptis chinensis]
MLDGIISFLERIHIKEPKKPPRKPEPDVISSLPQPIISHIASFLPTEEAIRSTILSTSWRNVCSSLSNLEFNQADFKKKKLDSEVFSRFVSHTLRSHDGSDVHKFTLKAYFETLPEPMLVNEWISFAVQHNVKEIYISLHTMTPVTLPCCLFTSPTITLLDLFNFRLKLPSVIHLSNLQHLQIESLYFCNEMSLINLFSNLSCPLVNSCCVVSCPPYIPDLIPKSGWNLRSFSIANTFTNFDHNVLSLKLDTFLYHGSPPNIHPKFFYSMKTVTISLLNRAENLTEDCRRATNIIVGLRNVKALWLNRLTVKYLAHDERSLAQLPISFRRMKILGFHLYPKTNQVQVLSFFLGRCPNLINLVIKFLDGSRLGNVKEKYWQLPKSCDGALDNLKSIAFHLFYGSKSELELMRCIFSRAKNIEKMVIHYSEEKQKNVAWKKINSVFYLALVYKLSKPGTDFYESF